MAALDALEKQLDDIFVKKAPFQLPENAKKTIVEFLPWINLFFGVVSLWVAFALWRWVDWVNSDLAVINNAFRVYAQENLSVSPLVYLGIAVMAIVGVLYIMAFNATRSKKKSGWNLMFYALILTTVYGLVMLFTDYGGIGNFISTLIGTVIGLYLLFQIRSQYGNAPVAPAAPKPTDTVQ